MIFTKYDFLRVRGNEMLILMLGCTQNKKSSNLAEELTAAPAKASYHMKRYPLLLFFLLALLILIFKTPILAEGTKQIMPTNTGIEKIQASSPGAETFGFAWYGCPEENRLNIHLNEDGYYYIEFNLNG